MMVIDSMSGIARFDELSSVQVDALSNVAFGGDGGGVSRRTLASLERRGLIRRVERRDGAFRWDEWAMDAPVHIAFCEWCSDD